MKKSAIFIFSVILLGIISAQIIRAEENVPGLPAGLQPGAMEVSKEKIENNTAYLKSEWKTMLLKNKYTAPVISFLDGTLTAINPFFKIVLGVEYSFSWLFAFAVMFWLILFFIIYPISNSILGGKKIVSVIASFAITSLIGLSGVIKRAVDLLSLAINNAWIASASLGVTIVIVILLIAFGGGLKKFVEKQKAIEEREKEKRDRKVLSVSAEVEKERLDSMKKG